MILRDFPLYLMETLNRWCSLHGLIVVFMFLTTINRGSACEAPSSPQCFRRLSTDSIYICEWSMNTTENDVTFELYFNETKLKRLKENVCQIIEEQLIRHRPVYIWVEAHTPKSSCKSTRRSVILAQTVKYEAPKNISTSWLKNSLNLSWTPAEEYPALAEVWFRRHDHPTESWESRTTTTNNKYQVIVGNLLKDTAYQVQIRHRSKVVGNPLWSDWSPVMIVPAELEQKPEVTMTTRLMNGMRKVMLTWKPLPHAAAVTGVKYSLRDTQSASRCPCQKKRHEITSNKCTIYVSYSAVNISVTARNSAGYSPPAIVQVPAKSATDLMACDKTLLYEKKLNRQTCLELYELQDGDPRPENISTLNAWQTKQQRDRTRNATKDHVRYLYFEHKCDGGKPRTVKMCLFYKKEGAPHIAPQDLVTSSETHNSVNLSWKVIPTVELRGFLTHYRLCSLKVGSREEECHNISASVRKHRLENLISGTKYSISLAGVTRAGEGPKATVIVNMLPEKPVNVIWSLSLLFLFFFISTSCTCILKRIKNKILPPVPKPVLPDFTCYETQEMLDEIEEVHEVTLHQLHPEGNSVFGHAETIVSRGQWVNDTDEEVDSDGREDSRMSGGTSDESLSPGSTDEAPRSCRGGEIMDLESVDNEIATLIYRHGLVFDVKIDSI